MEGLGTLTLHELGEERRLFNQFIEQSEAPTWDQGKPAEAMNLLAQLDGAIEAKVERWGLWIVERQAEVTAIKAEETRLADRRAVLQRAIDNSKAQLKYEMQQLDLKDVRGTQLSVGIQLNPPKAVGDVDQATLADWHNSLTAPAEWQEFVREKPATYELDRKAIVEAYKNGVDLPPGVSVVRDASLRIR